MTMKGVRAQGLGAFVNALLSFGLLLVLARQLGPTTFGDYSVLLNAGSIALVVIEGGYPMLVYRETALNSAVLMPWRGGLLPLAVGSVLALTLLLAILPIGPWLSQGYVAWWAVLICMGLIAWINTYSGVLRGEGRFAAEASWQVAGRLSSMVAILIALNFEAVSNFAIFVAWSIGLLVLLGLFRSRRPPLPHFQLALPVRQAALHLMAGQLLFVVLTRLDLLGLSIIGRDTADTANYAVAARFFEVGFLLFAPIQNVLQFEFRQRLPAVLTFKGFLLRTTLGTMASALVGTLVGSAVAPWVVTFAFGREYADAVPLVGWVLSGLVLMLPSQVLAQAAIAMNFERSVWIAYSVGLLITLATLVTLVPTYGAVGAAWSMMVGHGCVLMVLTISLRAKLRPLG